MNRKEISRQIKDLALSSGFDAVGICSADPLEEERSRLLDWLNRGFAGSMSYLKRDTEKRLDPRQILPSAKSVIVLALNYFSDLDKQEEKERFGRVAKYARGRDYHKILERRLQTFAEKLRSRISIPFQTKYYVDTGPVMERPLAKRAGIGFTGKHTLTITRQFGSWIFLSEIITDLDLEPDKPNRRDCGSCTKCVEACPTGAIFNDYRLDATKCISYLTIENRGPIDPGLREKIGGWIFGCDICQDICPLNHHAKPANEGDFIQANGTLNEAGPWLDLNDLLSIRSDDEFYARFAGTPLTRPKREGLLRNAAIAAGNSGSKEWIPALESARANDVSEMVRESAAWALEKLADTAGKHGHVLG
ncbi:MAG: tRNA epoxyqueuosine(34) reductase QueG [Candidatus Omnitrophica bacterium]|nr:tRNA epoxyqueuosine(34) reductase QueG [Candidatus Omnitrophota bacterium]